MSVLQGKRDPKTAGQVCDFVSIYGYGLWCLLAPHSSKREPKTSQELRMLSRVTLNCQVTKIVMNSSSQLSEM